MTGVEIKHIPIGELYEFALKVREDRERYALMPINIARAIAHSENPAASKDEVGLAVAYFEGKCIGYIGILPCWVEVDGKIKKIYANTTFIIDQAFRHKPDDGSQTVGEMLVASTIELGYDFINTGYVYVMERFFQRNSQWFKPLGPLPYLRINLSYTMFVSSVMRKLVETSWLKPVRAIFRCFLFISRKTVDRIIWTVEYPLLRRSWRSQCLDVEARSVSEVREPEEDIEKQAAFNKAPHFYRNTDIVNWMIKYPWTDETLEDDSDYYFALPYERFFFQAYELYKKSSGKRIGFVVFSISTTKGYTTLKILDYKVSAKTYEPCIIDLTLRESPRWNVNVIECSHEFWKYIKASTILKRLTQRCKRGYFAAPLTNNVWGDEADEFCLGYCDSDKPFS
ncbi:MAG: hypothetical protein P9X24_05530 [Candidatus Hatepunaea meridiana]|nr:hypothetical protein [Candidatus Hatepunaea meridiana]